MTENSTQQAWFFDFDGVLADTALIKAEIFVELLNDLTPKETQSILSYCLREGGVPRREKFIYIHKELLKRTLNDNSLEDLCNEYTKKVVDRVLDTPLTPGTLNTLEDLPESVKAFVVSGTPHSEINFLCDEMGIAQYFKSVCGSPRPKSDWILDLLNQHSIATENAWMIGDSMTDLNAARSTGLGFVGVDIHQLGYLPETQVILPNLSPLKGCLTQDLYPNLEHV